MDSICLSGDLDNLHQYRPARALREQRPTGIARQCNSYGAVSKRCHRYHLRILSASPYLVAARIISRWLLRIASQDCRSRCVALRLSDRLHRPGKLVSRILRRMLKPSAAVVAIFFVLAAFVVYAFVYCTAGEFVAAIGSILGGLVGAGGAIAAVFFLIDRQRAEDQLRIGEAISKQVVVFTKIVIESLKICRLIALEKIVVEKKNACSMMMHAEPIIYKGVADRIGLYPYGQAVVEFYARVIQVQEALRVIVNGPAEDSEPVTSANVDTIAKALIMACQFAKIIIGSHVPRSDLEKRTAESIAAQIETALESAKSSF